MSNQSIEAQKWYTSSKAALLLGVTGETVKKYCRNRTLEAKQVGPKKVWHALGKSISQLRASWKIDD